MSYRLLVVDDDDAARTSLHSLMLAALPEAEIDLAADAAEALLSDGLESAQNRFHALSG